MVIVPVFETVTSSAETLASTVTLCEIEIAPEVLVGVLVALAHVVPFALTSHVPVADQFPSALDLN